MLDVLPAWLKHFLLGLVIALCGLVFTALVVLGYKNGLERRPGDLASGGYHMAFLAIGVVTIAASTAGRDQVMVVLPIIATPLLLGTWWGIKKPKL